MDLLGRIKQAASVEVPSKPIGYMLLQVQLARYSVEGSLGPPWRCSYGTVTASSPTSRSSWKGKLCTTEIPGNVQVGARCALWKPTSVIGSWGMLSFPSRASWRWPGLCFISYWRSCWSTRQDCPSPSCRTWLDKGTGFLEEILLTERWLLSSPGGRSPGEGTRKGPSAPSWLPLKMIDVVKPWSRACWWSTSWRSTRGWWNW